MDLNLNNAYKNHFLPLMRKDRNFTRLLILLIITTVVLSIVKTEKFINIECFKSMGVQFPEYGLMALGVMLTMLSGGIDLSVVGVANLSAVLAAKVMVNIMTNETAGVGLFAAMLIVILVGVLCGIAAGFINGFLISRIGIPPILATLASMQLFRGITIIITAGRAMSGLPYSYSSIGNTEVFGILPVPLIVFILMTVFVYILLDKTKYGQKLYMLGTNETAAVYSGVKVKNLLTRTYIYSGVFAAVAGLVMMARMNSARADYGTQYTLQSILVVVLGGVNPNGGFGKVNGVVMAILLLQFLSTGLNMFPAISNFYRHLIWGSVLLIVLIINFMQEVRKNNS